MVIPPCRPLLHEARKTPSLIQTGRIHLDHVLHGSRVLSGVFDHLGGDAQTGRIGHGLLVADRVADEGLVLRADQPGARFGDEGHLAAADPAQWVEHVGVGRRAEIHGHMGDAERGEDVCGRVLVEIKVGRVGDLGCLVFHAVLVELLREVLVVLGPASDLVRVVGRSCQQELTFLFRSELVNELVWRDS